MAAGYCYEGIPLRFLASLFDICTEALSSAYEISLFQTRNQFLLCVQCMNPKLRRMFATNYPELWICLRYCTQSAVHVITRSEAR